VVFVNEPAKNVVALDALQWGSGDGPFAGNGHAEINTSVRALFVVMDHVLPKDLFEVFAPNNTPDDV
jgi:hypothetical protein